MAMTRIVELESFMTLNVLRYEEFMEKINHRQNEGVSVRNEISRENADSRISDLKVVAKVDSFKMLMD